MSPSLIFLANLLSTWYLMGLIWMVQIVHYNLFDRVGSDGFANYEMEHTRLITPVVGPVMVVEIMTAGWLLFATPKLIPRSVLVAGFVAVLAIWLSTFLIQVPLHNRLVQGFTVGDHRALVNSNWIRTILWTLRGLVLGYYAHVMMR